MARQSFADVITDWQTLLATVEANKDDLQFIDNYRQQLATEVAGAMEASMRQSDAQAQASQATRDLEGFMTQGRDLAEKIRFGIKTKYGKRSEKLKVFGLKVFRAGGRKKSATAAKPQPQFGPPQGTPPPQTGQPQPGTSPPPVTKAAPQESTSESPNPS